MFKINGGRPSVGRTYDVTADPSRGLAAAQAGTQGIANMATQGYGYKPQGYKATTISGPGAIQAGQVASTNLNPYMNPYTDAVIDRGLADLNRAGQMQINDLGAAAEAAGAFGGSRHGVAEAETNRALQEQAANMAAGLRSDAFNNAQGMAQFDIGAQLQADTTSAGNALQAQLANQRAKNDAAAFTASAANTAGQFNSGQQLASANLGLNANRQLADIAGQGFGMGRAINADMAAAGAQERAVAQQLFDAVSGQYAGFTGAPAQGVGILSQALGSVPVPQSQSSTQSPGLFGLLSGLTGLF